MFDMMFMHQKQNEKARLFWRVYRSAQSSSGSAVVTSLTRTDVLLTNESRYTTLNRAVRSSVKRLSSENNTNDSV